MPSGADASATYFKIEEGRGGGEGEEKISLDRQNYNLSLLH